MKSSKGYSLLEALVTLLVVSFGLLGIAALIANSLKLNQSAFQRTQATWLANEIIDRMRANRVTAEVASSPYNLLITADSPTASTVPATDLREWRTALNASLPSGTGSVSYSSATGVVTVVVQWDDISRLASEARVANSGRVTVETRL